METIPAKPNPMDHLINADHIRLVLRTPSVFHELVFELAGQLHEADSEGLKHEKLQNMAFVRDAHNSQLELQRGIERGEDVASVL